MAKDHGSSVKDDKQSSQKKRAGRKGGKASG
jgi:hypothetical protein